MSKVRVKSRKLEDYFTRFFRNVKTQVDLSKYKSDTLDNQFLHKLREEAVKNLIHDSREVVKIQHKKETTHVTYVRSKGTIYAHVLLLTPMFDRKKKDLLYCKDVKEYLVPAAPYAFDKELDG